MTAWRRIVTAALAIVLAACLAPGVAARGEAVLGMSVLVYNDANLPPATLAAAREIVERIYADIGVELSWIDVGSTALQNAPDHVIYVSLRADTKEVRGQKADVLGLAFPGTHLAWVNFSRVARVAQSRQDDVAPLIGCVMAHEIGHLLLPSGSHSRFGIMQAVLDLNLVARNGLWFDSDQARLIRARLSAAE